MFDEMQELIKRIKEKKELAGLPDQLVEEVLSSIIRKRGYSNLEGLRKKESKSIVKDARAELRNYSGRFHGNIKDYSELNEESGEEILKSHASTREREEDYELIKEKIRELKIKSILDLGCGLNPIAVAEPGIKYYAADINEDYLKLIKKHFEKSKIDGEVFYFDLRKTEQIDNLPKAELCLLFKVFDVIEKKSHKTAEIIVKNVKAKHILASFSTKTLSGKPMNHPQRGWIERMLARLNYKYSSFKSKNEMFYLIEKSIPQI